jgi:hypothetical protein
MPKGKSNCTTWKACRFGPQMKSCALATLRDTLLLRLLSSRITL